MKRDCKAARCDCPRVICEWLGGPKDGDEYLGRACRFPDGEKRFTILSDEAGLTFHYEWRNGRPFAVYDEHIGSLRAYFAQREEWVRQAKLGFLFKNLGNP